ncbi:1968_t:CDS:1 [Cetraspora pellucida]|uniref:1968_t:CDS:1 n=1 Tax=Cetraspora pellucida TaxID=1433469 RepID=A0ACA9QIT0_9GLOM|nr:1968_t:CDS:1 [Cetraspora pellucida]
MPPKHVTAYSHAQEFLKDFVTDSGFLMYNFCCYSVNWRIKTNITAHIKTSGHKAKKNASIIKKQTRQPTLNSIIEANKSKKNTINNLICAFIQADISLKKMNKLRPCLNQYLRESSSISSANTLHRIYLSSVFENYLVTLKQMFFEKRISVIVDKTTNSQVQSVINVLFNYYSFTKLVAVDFLGIVNNLTIEQLVICILVE